MLQDTNWLEDAESVARRAVKISFILEVSNGRRSPKTLTIAKNYLRHIRKMELPDSEARTCLDSERGKAGLSEEAFEKLWVEVLAGA